jgi:Uma2 family endonuclease
MGMATRAAGLLLEGTTMPVMIYDPVLEKRIRTERNNSDVKQRDEVWEGVLVVPPLPNLEHQILVTDLALIFAAVINRAAGDLSLAGANVSDRDADWASNYREPDVLVILHGNPAKRRDTHLVGGPDLAVEIVSPSEDPRLKLDFYAKINTRELLIVDRDPWKVELYQLQGKKLVSVGTSDATTSAVLTSVALPLTFQLRPGTPRPIIHITHTGSGQTWTA